MAGIRSYPVEFGLETRTVSTGEEYTQLQKDAGLLHGLPKAYLTEGKLFR